MADTPDRRPDDDWPVQRVPRSLIKDGMTAELIESMVHDANHRVEWVDDDDTSIVPADA